MIWTTKTTARVRKILEQAPTLSEGYEIAARVIGTTPTAVRRAREAGKLGDVTPTTPAAEVAAHRAGAEAAMLGAAKRRLVKELADREDQIAALTALRRAKPLAPVTAPKRVSRGQRVGVPVMLCSDWHVEERVDPRVVDNEYNLTIADGCIAQLADAYEWLMRDARFDCRTGVVWLGGDLFSGYIHDELQEGNFLSPVEAVVWLQERIERMLRRIAATTNLERILVVCNDGNHGRLTHKIRVSTRTKNSLEWLMYKCLAARLADDPRFEFDIADGEWLRLDVLGYKLAFTHGDSFQYGGGVGGMSIPIRRGIARQFQGEDVHAFCMGHFHQRQDFGDIVINGSMIGPSAYSTRIHAKPEPRQQSWFMVDANRGKCLSAPVWLT